MRDLYVCFSPHPFKLFKEVGAGNDSIPRRICECVWGCVHMCVWKDSSVSVVKAYTFPDVLKCVQSRTQGLWGWKSKRYEDQQSARPFQTHLQVLDPASKPETLTSAARSCERASRAFLRVMCAGRRNADIPSGEPWVPKLAATWGWSLKEQFLWSKPDKAGRLKSCRTGEWMKACRCWEVWASFGLSCLVLL